MCPVDKYIGGAEHAAMHLLYARFVTKALRDMGYLDFDEPFLSLVHQGTILGADGQKMSKSRGNTISPDDYILRHGSDVFRMYLGFGFAYTEGGPWNDDGVKAIAKFVSRVERMADDAATTARAEHGKRTARPANSSMPAITPSGLSPRTRSASSSTHRSRADGAYERAGPVPEQSRYAAGPAARDGRGPDPPDGAVRASLL